MSVKPYPKLTGNIVKLISSPRKGIFVLVFLASVALLGFNFFGLDRKIQENTVTFGAGGYSPNYIKIHIGEPVTFKNEREEPFWPASNLHPTHEIYSEFDPKRQLGKNETWSFTFDKAGIWSYHDHLHPNNTGTVEVLAGFAAKDNKQPTSLEDCSDINENAKQQCWDELLTYTIRRKGLSAAFDIFAKIYQSDPEIPKGCHGWTHTLGKEAYELFRKKKKFILKEETAYCGYGFFHGFIEQLLQETGELSQTKEFCEYAAEQLNNPGDVYNNCLHGVGHGSINIDDPSLWGNFEAMLKPGLDNCEKILTDLHDLGSCYVGAINAMTANITDGLYNLKLKDNELYGYCRQMEEKYKPYCYYEFTGMISKYTNHDFAKAIKLILAEDMGKSTQKRAIGKMQAIWMTYDIVKSSYQDNVFNCRSLGKPLYEVCFEGILDGLMINGDPGREYVRGFKFCEEKVLTENERGVCYEYIIGRSSPDVCKMVPEIYKQYCR